MILLWCEIERVERQLLPLLEEREEGVVLCRSVAEGTAALADFPEISLLVVSFAGLPLPHAQAACRRFRAEGEGRRLRFLGVVEAGQLAGFDPTWGLDDFLLFPVSPAELAARLSQLAWRGRDLQTETLLKFGPLLLDTARHEVSFDNQPVSLTIKEYELLLFLVGARDRLLTREAILEEVWGADYLGGERTVDVHIRRLRAKLPALTSAVETVHGLGYRFSPRLLST